ncbi:conserved hypothetical protein [Roseibium sp. TrichSKD4]|uniref:alginate export family protein n=1 Tax=Roseibium sp. TrichSKD4 TaxID=744980 RepID=UPI0001E575B6|nr:alginate export family protein [Roseibium sp. TrichSKD4]EFO29393.1 conserved hypothetical protein [Roseibium sp. TrichSKD4]
MACPSRARRLSDCSAIILFILLGAPTAGMAQTTDPLLFKNDSGFEAKLHFQAGLNLVAEGNLFWTLSDTFARTADYDPDKGWVESYLKPGISLSQALTPTLTLYGKASAVASYTRGTDAYDIGQTGRITLEEGYIGIQKRFDNLAKLDFSIGPRELRLGTGMLIANGGSSGFERGALKFGPRKAWEMAAISQAKLGDVSATAFYLDPNEMPSTDNENELAGIDVRYDGKGGGFAGVSFVNVLSSNSSYPKAASQGIGPPTVIPGARDGLNAINFYAHSGPLKHRFGTAYFALDGAIETNNKNDMFAWGGHFQVGHIWTDMRWLPSLTYTYKTFSGDNPNTPEQERFDPLYYDGSPSTWATGSKSSMTFINSNVRAHELAFNLKPSPRDSITLRYAHIRANELRSPIQFGQATRFEIAGGDNIVAGVTDAHLADDFFLEYSRVVTPNSFLTAGLSASLPGKGLDLAAGRDLPVWYGGFVNLVINY